MEGTIIDPVRVLIYGSCVSRDAFNYESAKGFQFTEYYARSSFASAFHPKSVVHELYSSIESPFQKRLVKADLLKTSKTSIVNGDYDLLLIDFIDERFALFVLDEGGVVTVSNELVSGGFDAKTPPVSGHVVKSGSEEFLELWKTGWSGFVEAMRAENRMEKVVINRVFWAGRTESGHPFDGFNPQSANRFLETLYSLVAKDIPEDQFITYPESVLLGSDQHRWGLSPFHYMDAFYSVTAEGLRLQSQRIGKALDSRQRKPGLSKAGSGTSHRHPEILLPVDSRVTDTQGFLILDTASGVVSGHATDEVLPFNRKGFRGACVVNDRVYVCNSFSIKRYEVRRKDGNVSFVFEDQWYRPEWSVGQAANADLHCLFYDKSRHCLLLANSFNDCIDTLSLDGELLDRRYLWEVCPWVRELLSSKDPRAADLCHLNHIEKVGNDLVATLGNLNGTKKGAVVNLRTGEKILDHLSRPHDGASFGGDYFLVETPEKRVLRYIGVDSASALSQSEPRVYDLSPHFCGGHTDQIWMRGLLVKDGLMYVGCSQFQDRIQDSPDMPPICILEVCLDTAKILRSFPVTGVNGLDRPVVYSLLDLEGKI